VRGGVDCGERSSFGGGENEKKGGKGKSAVRGKGKKKGAEKKGGKKIRKNAKKKRSLVKRGAFPGGMWGQTRKYARKSSGRNKESPCRKKKEAHTSNLRVKKRCKLTSQLFCTKLKTQEKKAFPKKKRREGQAGARNFS